MLRNSFIFLCGIQAKEWSPTSIEQRWFPKTSETTNVEPSNRIPRRSFKNERERIAQAKESVLKNSSEALLQFISDTSKELEADGSLSDISGYNREELLQEVEKILNRSKPGESKGSFTPPSVSRNDDSFKKFQQNRPSKQPTQEISDPTSNWTPSPSQQRNRPRLRPQAKEEAIKPTATPTKAPPPQTVSEEPKPFSPDYYLDDGLLNVEKLVREFNSYEDGAIQRADEDLFKDTSNEAKMLVDEVIRRVEQLEPFEKLAEVLNIKTSLDRLQRQSYQRQKDDAVAKMVEANTSREQLAQALDGITERHENLMKEHDDLSSSLSQYQDQIDFIQREKKALEEEKNDYENHLEQLDDVVKSAEGRLISMNQEKLRSEQRIAELNDFIQTMEGIFHATLNKLKTLENDKKRLERELQIVESERDALRAGLQVVVKRCIRLESILREQHIEIEKYVNALIEEFDSVLDELSDGLEWYSEEEVSELTDSIASLVRFKEELSNIRKK